MRKDEPMGEPAATVTMYPDGPLIVRGDFVVRDLDGAELAGGHTVALCRCGRSAVKPFCDGTHKRPSVAAAGQNGFRGPARRVPRG